MQKEKKEGSGDIRVRRTRKMLLQALMDLTVERGFTAITVSDICERAMVNRSTFYRYYLDKYDLLDQYLREVYALISAEPPEAEIAGEGVGRPPAGLINLLNHIQNHADFYREMIGARGDPAFFQGLRRDAEVRFREVLAKEGSADPGGPPVDMRVSYVSYAGMGAIFWWLENGRPCSPEQLAGWVGQLSRVAVGLHPPPRK